MIPPNLRGVFPIEFVRAPTSYIWGSPGDFHSARREKPVLGAPPVLKYRFPLRNAVQISRRQRSISRLE